nr:unnamed protein product [Digitaria exilis]
MDGIMASAATGVMSSLLAKLAELLSEDYQVQKGMRHQIAFLKDELSSMNTLLERLADMEVLDPQTCEWRNQVREMTYDIEDCVDDYMRQLHNGPQRPGGVMGFFLGYVQKVKELVSRCEIGEQIKALRDRIVEAGHRRKRYKIDDVVNSTSIDVVPVDRRLPALYAELGGLVGINVPTDEIIKLFGDGDQGMKVVSVVGCGGIGKTTSILSQVKKDECDSTSSSDKELLISELRDFLKDKRKLIVNIHCQGARIEEVEALEAAIRIGASMLPNHPKPDLHRFQVAEMVMDDGEREKEGHEEDKRQVPTPAWFFFNSSGSGHGEETTLSPCLDLLHDG